MNGFSRTGLSTSVRGLLLLVFSLVMSPTQAAPQIQTWKTAKGLDVYFVSAPQLPMLDLRLVYDAGSARDGDKPGLARLSSALLGTGAGDWDADQIASRFESVGAQFSTGALKDMAWVSLRSLSDAQWLEPALQTYLQVVQAPRFPRRDFARLKKQTYIALRGQAEDPGSIASNAFYKAVYGDHPYGSPSLGTQASVKSISRADIKAFYKKYYVAGNAVLTIVGNLDHAQAQALAERISAGMNPGAHAPPLPPVAPVSEAQTIRIAFPSEQAHVLVGQTGLRRKDPDYFALYVGNHILGGSGFSSRLVKAVRVKRGLSYSVYSYFLPMAVDGPLIMGLQTRGDQATQAVQVLEQTVKAYVKDGPTQEELEGALRNITGGFALRTASNSDIVEYVAMIGFYHLPLDYLDRFTAQVNKVDAQQIRQAYARRVHPEKFITVIVGGGTTK